MTRIRLVNIIRDFPFIRQMPKGFAEERYLHFVRNDENLDGEPDDFLICYDELKYALPTRVPRERRVLFIGEPPCITRYPAEFLNLFGTVVCSYNLPLFHGRHIRSHSSLWWFYGMNPKDMRGTPVLSWDELAAMPVPEKTGLISTVCGNKAWCRMHKRRREFTNELLRLLGDRLTAFGPGYLPVPDKRDAIDPFRYHIVVENNDEPGFWTEKLADAFLGCAFPFYVGGAGVELDFPEGSMMRIDVRKPELAVEVMESCLSAGVWEERLPLIRAAREKILREHNLFFRLEALLRDLPRPSDLPALDSPDILPDFNAVRHKYHLREHLNHQAFKYLPLRRPLFPL